MGRTYRPKYRIEWKTVGFTLTNGTWDNKYNGKPTKANFEKYVEAMAASLEPGGVNYVPPLAGRTNIGRIYGAVMIDQDTNKVVFEHIW